MESFVGAAFKVLIAWLAGYALFKIIHPREPAKSARDYGDISLAWATLLNTTAMFSMAFNSDEVLGSLIIWLTTSVVFGLIAYLIGRLIGNFSFAKKVPVKQLIASVRGANKSKVPDYPTQDIEVRLERLKALHDTLVISDAEYADKRKSILDSL